MMITRKIMTNLQHSESSQNRVTGGKTGMEGEDNLLLQSAGHAVTNRFVSGL